MTRCRFHSSSYYYRYETLLRFVDETCPLFKFIGECLLKTQRFKCRINIAIGSSSRDTCVFCLRVSIFHARLARARFDDVTGCINLLARAVSSSVYRIAHPLDVNQPRKRVACNIVLPNEGMLHEIWQSRMRAPLGGKLDQKPLYARRGDFGVDERAEGII